MPPGKRRVCFLGWDGVGNNWEMGSDLDFHRQMYADPKNIEELNRLVQKVEGLEFVFSSRHRLTNDFAFVKRKLVEFGFLGAVVDVTPSSLFGPFFRGVEIATWLDSNFEFDEEEGTWRDVNFVVFDACPVDVDNKPYYSFAPVEQHLIRTDPMTGLTFREVVRAALRLRRK